MERAKLGCTSNQIVFSPSLTLELYPFAFVHSGTEHLQLQ